MKTREITIHIREGVPVEEAENALTRFAEWVGHKRFDYTANADGQIQLWSDTAWYAGYATVKRTEE